MGILLSRSHGVRPSAAHFLPEALNGIYRKDGTQPCVGVLYFSIPFFWQGFVSGEMSSNSGGLIRWPVYLTIPVGFTLLLLQGISEAIKRVAFLRGALPSPFVKESDETPPAGGAEGAR